MDRAEASNRILMIIEMVEESGPFTGRAYLLNSLRKFQDLVVLYKPTSNIYELIIDEAERLVKDIQKRLDEKAKGG